MNAAAPENIAGALPLDPGETIRSPHIRCSRWKVGAPATDQWV